MHVFTEPAPSFWKGDYDREIQQHDLPYLASCFDDVEYYLDAMELASHEKTDVRRTVQTHGTQVGMNKCLDCWRGHNPSTSTIAALLDILFKLRKGAVASKVCEYWASRSN